MAKKPTPLAGEATTTNYGWVKPTVGSSVDLWGGYINADLDSIDGVVHAIDTRPFGVTVSDTPPANPLVGQEWFDGVSGQLYVWYDDGNSSQWVIAVNAAASLLPATTTVLGAVKVDGTTIKAAPDGTISTTVVPMGDNRIINGDMRIDQRNNGASGTANGYTVDRWQYFGTQASKNTWERLSNAIAPGFPYALQSSTSIAYAPVAGDTFWFQQPIEADAISDFAWGAAGAQPVTLSFWAVSSLTGTFSGAVTNFGGGTPTRSYPFTFSLPTAFAWTRVVIIIPGDTSGTWVLSGNAGSLFVRFDLGSGSTYRAPAGVWASGNFNGANGAVNIVATQSCLFQFTGVKLEIGSVATPYNRQSLAKSMADCQRYYQVGQLYMTTGASPWAIGASVACSSLHTPMRATATTVITTNSNVNISSPAVTDGVTMFYASGTSTDVAVSTLNMNFTASAEL